MACGGRICAAVLASAALLTSGAAEADTLREALARAYATNPTLEAARSTQEAADETVPIARADGRPSVSASGSYSDFVLQDDPTGLRADRLFSTTVQLSVPVYSGGAVTNGIQAAQNRVEAGRFDLRGTESTLFSQVVAAYMDVIQNEAIVELSRNNVAVLQTNLEATRDRFEIGDLTRTDIAQSESRLALARSDLRSARSNLIESRERYINLVGNEPGELEPPPPLPGLPSGPEEAVDIALANNPDILAALERVEAAGFDINVARAGRMPRVSAFVDGGYSNTLGSLVGASAEPTATAGVRVTMPLYQGGRASALVRQSQARRRATLDSAIATERGVIAQVRAAYASWQASLAIITSNQTAVEAAALSLEGVRAENTVGNRTVLDILNAEQELLRAQVQLVTARRNAYVAGFTLLAAMGRAEARDLGLEAYGPLYDPITNYERVEGEWWDWRDDPAEPPQSTRTVDTTAQDGEISAGTAIQTVDPNRGY